MYVCLFMGGKSHVTITYDVLDLIIQPGVTLLSTQGTPSLAPAPPSVQTPRPYDPASA